MGHSGHKAFTRTPLIIIIIIIIIIIRRRRRIAVISIASCLTDKGEHITI